MITQMLITLFSHSNSGWRRYSRCRVQGGSCLLCKVCRFLLFLCSWTSPSFPYALSHWFLLWGMMKAHISVLAFWKITTHEGGIPITHRFILGHDAVVVWPCMMQNIWLITDCICEKLVKWCICVLTKLQNYTRLAPVYEEL